MPSVPSVPLAPALTYVEYFTSDGTPYYYNTYTKTTQWEKPIAPATIIQAPQQRPETKQPSFFHTLNSITSGEKPQSYVGVSRYPIRRDVARLGAMYLFSTCRTNGVILSLSFRRARPADSLLSIWQSHQHPSDDRQVHRKEQRIW